ncbi:MAG: RES family NAD+ phosphorylase [Bryobacteraceae bacterium]
MRVYRIARQKWIGNLSGSGVPGRWNQAGKRMLYTASSLALALLEMLVHVERDQLPNYMWVAADVPDDYIEHISAIPSDPASYGTAWLERPGATVALAVPSVIIPEQNVLLNPGHTDFSRIAWADSVTLEIDPRLIQVP